MPSTWASLSEVWAGWARSGEELADEDWQRPTRLPGWKVIDLFAHAAAWPLFLQELVNGDEVDAEPQWASASDVLRHFNTPGGMAETAAPAVAERARRQATTKTPDDLLDQFRAGLATIEGASHVTARVVVYPGAGTIHLHEAAKIGLLEAVVHRLDLDEALDQQPALPPHCLSMVAGILAAVPGLVSFIEGATGRSDSAVLPVLR